jgi:hypothetical protein
LEALEETSDSIIQTACNKIGDLQITPAGYSGPISRRSRIESALDAVFWGRTSAWTIAEPRSDDGICGTALPQPYSNGEISTVVAGWLGAYPIHRRPLIGQIVL